MKKTVHSIWMLFSFLACAGKKVPADLPLSEDSSVLQKNLPPQQKAEEKPRAEKEESSDQERKTSQSDCISSKKAASLLTLSKNLFSQAASFLMPRDMVKLACTNHKMRDQIRDLHGYRKDHSVEELKKRCANGDLGLFWEIASLEKHLYYPEEVRDDFLEKIFLSDEYPSLINGISNASPLVLVLSKKICEKLKEKKKEELEEPLKEEELLAKQGQLAQVRRGEPQEKFKNWKQIIKAKNIPIMVQDLAFLDDPDLSPQIVRLLVDLDELRVDNWDHILETVKKNNIQLTVQLYPLQLIQEPVVNILDTAKKIFKTGRVSELVCGGNALHFKSLNWEELMNMAGQVRAFSYASQTDTNNVSVVEFLQNLSQKMPRLNKLFLLKHLNGYATSLPEIGLHQLRELSIDPYIPYAAERLLSGVLSMFPKNIKCLELFRSISVPQAYFVLGHFQDLYRFGMPVKCKTCPPVLFPDFVDTLGRHKNLQEFRLQLRHVQNLDVLAEKISLFPKLIRLELNIKSKEMLQSQSMEKMLKSLASLSSFEMLTFVFRAESFFPEFILRALQLLSERSSIDFALSEEDLQKWKEVAANANPKVLRRVRSSEMRTSESL
jgi:hypothetical protein